ncbi:MAG: hypothetical protein IPL26_19700 [Leptospiraceae bacterium]|nr:hypothetical protein [Leptospiraceae bacterium]
MTRENDFATNRNRFPREFGLFLISPTTRFSHLRKKIVSEYEKDAHEYKKDAQPCVSTNHYTLTINH